MGSEGLHGMGSIGLYGMGSVGLYGMIPVKLNTLSTYMVWAHTTHMA